jgi:hypothetical protein
MGKQVSEGQRIPYHHPLHGMNDGSPARVAFTHNSAADWPLLIRIVPRCSAVFFFEEFIRHQQRRRTLSYSPTACACLAENYFTPTMFVRFPITSRAAFLHSSSGSSQAALRTTLSVKVSHPSMIAWRK